MFRRSRRCELVSDAIEIRLARIKLQGHSVQRLRVEPQITSAFSVATKRSTGKPQRPPTKSIGMPRSAQHPRVPVGLPRTRPTPHQNRTRSPLLRFAPLNPNLGCAPGARPHIPHCAGAPNRRRQPPGAVRRPVGGSWAPRSGRSSRRCRPSAAALDASSSAGSLRASRTAPSGA